MDYEQFPRNERIAHKAECYNVRVVLETTHDVLLMILIMMMICTPPSSN